MWCPLATRIMDSQRQCSSMKHLKHLVQAGHREKILSADNAGVANYDRISNPQMLGPFQPPEIQCTGISCNFRF